MDRLMTVSELAQVLGLSPKTVYKRDPETLPPPRRVPGTKGPRWLESDVEAWLAALPKAIVPSERFHQRPGRKRKVVP